MTHCPCCLQPLNDDGDCPAGCGHPPLHAIPCDLHAPTPMLPYAGTSGWSGSDTSQARAEHDDAGGEQGVTGKRQRAVLDLAARCGTNGITWLETAEALNIHHGAASGALSVLHKEGRLARLALSRGDAKIYVLPLYAEGRAIEAHGRTSSNADRPILNEAITLLKQRIDCEHDPVRNDCWSCRARVVVILYDKRSR